MIRELAQGIDGIVTIIGTLPGQAMRTFEAIRHVPLGENSMNSGYYFGNPQLFKMPKQFREPGPPLSQPPVGAFEEGTVAKALPYIAAGIAAIVLYNMFGKK